MTSEGPAPARAARVAAVVVAVVLVIAGAALSGPMTLRGRVHAGPTVGAPPTHAAPPTPPPDRHVASHWLPALNVAIGATIVLYALVLVVLLVLALAALRWRWVRRTRRDPAPAQPGSADTMDELLAPAVAAGVQSASVALRADLPPGDAVVAAWMALEHAAQDSGVTREPAQTPTEFTVAVLDRTDADRAATRGLLDLYLRARFSSHTVAPADVRAARAFLETLADGLAHERTGA